MMAARSDWMGRFEFLAQTPARDLPPTIRYNPSAHTISSIATSTFWPDSDLWLDLDLTGIAEGLNALTEYKRSELLQIFNNLRVSYGVNHVNRPRYVMNQALEVCTRRFNGENSGSGALFQLGLSYPTWNTDEAENYRRVLPVAKRFIATDLQSNASFAYKEIHDAAFRFVHGHNDKSHVDKGFLDLTTINNGCITAKNWEVISF